MEVTSGVLDKQGIRAHWVPILVFRLGHTEQETLHERPDLILQQQMIRCVFECCAHDTHSLKAGDFHMLHSPVEHVTPRIVFYIDHCRFTLLAAAAFAAAFAAAVLPPHFAVDSRW